MKRLLTATSVAAVLATGAFAQSFQDLDGDSDGRLTLQEVQAAVPAVTQRAYDAYDADADGYLSEAEFAAWVEASKQAMEESKTQDMDQ